VAEAAAYFDVDGTLVSTNLLQPTWVYLSNQATPAQSLMRVGRALLGAPAMAIAEMRDRRMFNEMLFSYYQGMSNDRVQELAVEIFEDVLKPKIFKGAHNLIERCHQAGQDVILVTGSLDCTTKLLAQHLNADRIISNRLEMKGGKATGKLLRPVVAGPEKARLIVRDARDHGYDLAKCFGYSDSYSDVPMLSVVGHPACINPDKRLVRLARAYDWPIIDIDQAPRGSSGQPHGAP